MSNSSQVSKLSTTDQMMVHGYRLIFSLFILSSFVLIVSLVFAEQLIHCFGAKLAGLSTWGFYLAILAIVLNQEIGIKQWLQSKRGRWITSALLCLFYVAVYFQPMWIKGWILLISPLSIFLTKTPADQWFLYSFLYTYAVAIFGYNSLKKHGHVRYHKLRTASLFFFQLIFAFLIPALLKRAQLPDFYFTYFWPLKPDYLLPFDYVMHPQTGIMSAQINGLSVGRAMILWGAMMSLLATPILTYYFGKRWYCSWVCGCGALAETFGDIWRNQSSTSHKAWRLERYMIHLSLLVTIMVTAILWINESGGRNLLGEDGSRWFWGGYGLWMTLIFSGVIGVGFYPLLGSRVWCRFGCPQAAILGLLQRFFSRFRISTNSGQCVSCGHCSAQCEMGIDVRAYAQEGQVIVRASCVGCGVCASVCPRGVLRLENTKLP